MFNQRISKLMEFSGGKNTHFIEQGLKGSSFKVREEMEHLNANHALNHDVTTITYETKLAPVSDESFITPCQRGQRSWKVDSFVEA